MTDKTTYLISAGAEPAERGDRDSIGGWPVLDAGQDWPMCGCGSALALYFQVGIPGSVPHFGGDQLLVFCCPAEGDCAPMPGTPLPERYWDTLPANEPHGWRILLQRTGIAHQAADPYFTPRRLTLTAATDYDDEPGFEGPLQGFKIGGAPSWVQDAEEHRCACGAEMVFLCQVSEDFPFRKFADPGLDPSIRRDAIDEGLFLGNQVYLLACPDRCDPAALWPVCQN
ncbi:hypothetical protein ACFXK0_03035 [Nocardia sp. NPDC059177]|uniref:hypothetical protein n=1 Tax=Nocardia sp. NPDC059177 TaxID=3346759 RepID=UPI0036C11667